MSQRIIKIILVIAAVGTFSFVFYPVIKVEWSQIYDKYFPCTRPIVYSLGSFDPKFGISKKDFLEIMAQAEMIWEKPISKNLFEYKQNADNSLKVNLIYDYRQEATAKIRDLGLSVSDTRASYDALKIKYDAMQKAYLEEKAIYQAETNNFKKNQMVDDLNAKVADINALVVVINRLA